jgi:hypothetical protein
LSVRCSPQEIGFLQPWKTDAGEQLTPAEVLNNLNTSQVWGAMGQKIRVGQVWKKAGTGETFLVTKIYNEALSTIAVLRPTGAATESMLRVRVERQGEEQTLPGYSMAQADG